MSIETNFIPATPRKYRKHQLVQNQSTPALSLVTAVYSINDALVTLTFNREINLDDLDVSAFWINDGIYTNQRLQGDSLATSDATSVQIAFTQVESYSGSTTTLDASALNGIKDASTSESWDGVTGYVLTIG